MIPINATTPQLKAVKDLFDAYLILDINKIEPFISKDYSFQTFPKISDLPDEPKEAYFERFAPLFSLMTKIEYNIHEAIEAPGKVVLHVSVVCHTVDDDKLDYDSLAILTLVEEDGGLKVAELKDFSDPEKRGNLHGWVAKALSKTAA